MTSRGKKTAGLPVKGTTSSIKKGNGKKKGSNKGTDFNSSFSQSPEHTGTVSSIEYTTLPSTITKAHLTTLMLFISYLTKLDESNQALIKRVSKLEASKSFLSTPSPRSQPGTGHSLMMHPPVTQTQLLDTHVTMPVAGSMPIQSTAVAPNLTSQIQNTQATTSAATVDHQPLHYGTDGVLPSVSALRQNPTISESVAQVMASYEAQARQEASLGKQIPTKKSGRFNATDAITFGPELRWPNEGYQGTSYMMSYHYLSGR